ncbi:hypothetical protein BDY19DRAFT_998973 [Irpex rosettiformis]|uniref:Uncharacterized protein n=1 Tax=Irpex rosettiformis TaxID=378272 RepID=A0ACB8TLY6_9APHY|nr:hypothetical protein BDY19DRAFT_998973 [Irpex rosettiformis]
MENNAQYRPGPGRSSFQPNPPLQSQTGPKPPFQTSQPRVGGNAPSRPAMVPVNTPRVTDKGKYSVNFDPNDSDQIMEDISLPKPNPPPNQPRPPLRNTRNDPEQEINRDRSPRKSDIQNQVDSQVVLTKLLQTPVTLAVGEVLGVSREMSHQLQEVMKVKSIRPTTNNSRTTESVRKDKSNAENIPQAASHLGQAYLTNVQESTFPYPPRSRAGLIRVKILFGTTEADAIVDTGSELNIVKHDFWKKYINVPRDLSRQVMLSDANGGAAQLDGEVKGVRLNMGSFYTIANLYIGSNPPFDLLLGRSWQQGNLVSIDERRDGTYLLFKDPQMNVRYELAALDNEVGNSEEERAIRKYMEAHFSYMATIRNEADRMSHLHNMDIPSTASICEVDKDNPETNQVLSSLEISKELAPNLEFSLTPNNIASTPGIALGQSVRAEFNITLQNKCVPFKNYFPSKGMDNLQYMEPRNKFYPTLNELPHVNSLEMLIEEEESGLEGFSNLPYSIAEPDEVPEATSNVHVYLAMGRDPSGGEIIPETPPESEFSDNNLPPLEAEQIISESSVTLSDELNEIDNSSNRELTPNNFLRISNTADNPSTEQSSTNTLRPEHAERLTDVAFHLQRLIQTLAPEDVSRPTKFSVYNHLQSIDVNKYERKLTVSVNIHTKSIDTGRRDSIEIHEIFSLHYQQILKRPRNKTQ